MSTDIPRGIPDSFVNGYSTTVLPRHFPLPSNNTKTSLPQGVGRKKNKIYPLLGGLKLGGIGQQEL